MTNRVFLFLLLVFSLITMGANLGAFDANLMEARNFVTAREMLRYGNWWESTMNGLPRLEKPPLPTWITAVFGSFSDHFSVWLLRLPAMLMGLLLVLWTYLFGKSILEDENKARWSAFVAASSLLIITQARTGTWDIYFVSFAIGSFVYLHRGLKKHGNSMLDFTFGGVLFGCAILSKGPVPIIMLLGFASGLLLTQGFKFFLTKWKELIWAGILAGIIGFTWPVYNMFFQVEAANAVINKEAVTWTTKHVKPFYFYIIFPVYMGIWAIPTVLALIPKIARRWVGHSYWAFVVWLVTTIFFLSLLPMKKERYLLPAMPVVALMVGSFLGALSQRDQEEIDTKKVVFWSSFGVVGVGFSLAPAALILLLLKKPEAVGILSWIGAALLCICGLSICWQLWQSKFRGAMLAAGSGVAIVCALLLTTGEKLHYKNLNYVPPSTLMEHEELQNRKLYGPEDADMRMVYELGHKLLPLDEGLKAANEVPVAVLHYSPPKIFEKQYPKYNIQFIDSSSQYRKNVDTKVYAYLMQLK